MQIGNVSRKKNCNQSYRYFFPKRVKSYKIKDEQHNLNSKTNPVKTASGQSPGEWPEVSNRTPINN